METTRFDYILPPELIAQHPVPDRKSSRMLRYQRAMSRRAHHPFSDIVEILKPGDVLVRNNTRVFFARFHGTRASTGGRVEVFFLHPCNESGTPYDDAPYRMSPDRVERWLALTKSGGKLLPGETITLPGDIDVVIEKRLGWQGDVVRVTGNMTRFISEILPDTPDAATVSEIPLPPYLKRAAGESTDADRTAYQTVYAAIPGAVAAPTAGLHFTPDIFEAIRARDIDVIDVTLHVGAGTFRPVKGDRVETHDMHSEWFSVSQASADAINSAKQNGRRIVAVGTTSLRVLESASDESGIVSAGNRWTKLFIYPPAPFRIVDALLTNFHLPKSTLIMLVAAFLSPNDENGIDIVMDLYQEAIRERYRFFSYGDCMLIE